MFYHHIFAFFLTSSAFTSFHLKEEKKACGRKSKKEGKKCEGGYWNTSIVCERFHFSRRVATAVAIKERMKKNSVWEIQGLFCNKAHIRMNETLACVLIHTIKCRVCVKKKGMSYIYNQLSHTYYYYYYHPFAFTALSAQKEKEIKLKLHSDDDIKWKTCVQLLTRETTLLSLT